MRPNQLFGSKNPLRNHIAVLALPVLAGMVLIASSARADDFAFSISGSGMSASGVLQVSNTGPFGAYTVTGINGTFSDSTNNFSGAISGPLLAPAPTTDGVDTYFNAPAFTNFNPSNPPASYFSYDDLFWPGGNSPAVCVEAPVFLGGDFDIYGLAFNVTDGADVYTVDLWSDGPNMGGYQLNDELVSDPFIPPNQDGLAYAVNFSAAPTPEPGSLALLGSGALGLVGVLRKKRTS